MIRLEWRPCSYLLLALLGAFCLRVLAQWIQWLNPLPLLPPFAAWHSATLPYPWLLASQLAIIAGAGVVIARIRRGTYNRSRRRGLVLLVLGSVYFGLMLVRLLAGLTLLAGHPWFDAPLPAIFHLVLAAFLLSLGWYELSARRDE